MQKNSSQEPSVAILMGVYNGKNYINEQLASIAQQTHKNWCLFISDDGSTDDTPSLVNRFKQVWKENQIVVRQGPRKGFCQNFLAMACDSSIEADYFAFADQDDVWLPEKLSVAVKHIENNAQLQEPYLYCGRTTYVKDDLKPYTQSPLFVYPRTFRNALIQSIAGGNTMVFNRAAKKLIEKAGLVPAVSHDWWLYQLITGAGGRVHYDETSYILYRQHENALVGGNNSIKDRLERIWLVFRGQFREWNSQNIQALNQARHCLNQNAQEILDLFIRLRDSSFSHRFRMLEVCGLYRQTWRDTVSLMLAATIKKI